MRKAWTCARGCDECHASGVCCVGIIGTAGLSGQCYIGLNLAMSAFVIGRENVWILKGFFFS